MTQFSCGESSAIAELNGAPGTAAAEPPLRDLGRWLDDLGARAGPVRAAYAEWLATTTPTWFTPGEAAALVERTTGRQEKTEEGMAFSVMEEKVRRQIRRAERTGRREGHADGLALGLEHERKLLRDMARRRFGDTTATRLAPLLADVEEPERLGRIGEWLDDCADGAELIARFGNGADGGA